MLALVGEPTACGFEETLAYYEERARANRGNRSPVALAPAPVEFSLAAGDPALVVWAVEQARGLIGEPGSQLRATAVEAMLPRLLERRALVADISRRLLLDGIVVELPRCADAAEEFVEVVRIVYNWREPGLSEDEETALYGASIEQLEHEAEDARTYARCLESCREIDAVAARMGLRQSPEDEMDRICGPDAALTPKARPA